LRASEAPGENERDPWGAGKNEAKLVESVAQGATESTLLAAQTTIGVEGDELDQYLNECATTLVNHLNWWRCRLPHSRLYRLVCMLGVIPASGSSAERQFSKSKRQLTKHRLRLADDTLDSMATLLENIEIAAEVIGFSGVTAADLKRKSRMQDVASE
jgi:hypothetical protein